VGPPEHPVDVTPEQPARAGAAKQRLGFGKDVRGGARRDRCPWAGARGLTPPGAGAAAPRAAGVRPRSPAVARPSTASSRSPALDRRA